MTREEAIEYYLKYRPNAKKAIQNIQDWRPEKSLRENAVSLGINITSATQLRIVYGLECLKVRGWISGRHPASAKVEAFIALRASGWTLPAIASLFSVSRQSVDQSIRSRVSA